MDRTRALLAAIAREGNVAAAARAVGMDPANARRHLRAAEARLGTALVLARRGGSDGRNAALTAAARRLLTRAAVTGVVGAYDEEEGVTPVAVGARTIHAAGKHPPGLAALEVDPAAVALARAPRGGTSVRNQLPMVVESLEPGEEGMYRARLVAGALRLEALVVRGAVRDLRLRKGSRVVASVKATAVRVTPIG